MLVTDRLHLMPITLADQEAVFSTLNYKNSIEAISLFDWPLDDAQVLAWCARSEDGYARKCEYILLALSKGESLAVGGIGLHLCDEEPGAAETGYWVDQKHQRRGYAVEMLQEIMRFGFSALGLYKIYATAAHDNDRSGRVLEKCGFTFVEFIDVVCADGSVRKSKKFVITPSNG